MSRYNLCLFFLFVLRVVLRNQWVAAAVFALILATLSLGSTSHPFLDFITNFLVVGGFAFVVLRWGILALAITLLAGNVVAGAPITSHSSAWYFPSVVFMLACVAALAAWAFRTAIAGRRLWKTDLFG